MEIRKCTLKDVPQLALLNKQLIEDEKSNNPMSVNELEERMTGFLNKEYDAYFFVVEEVVVGYALVKNSCTPLYLRQFLIERSYRKQHYGTEAFQALLEELGAEQMEIEVLPWNERGLRFWESCGFKEISRYMRFEKQGVPEVSKQIHIEEYQNTERRKEEVFQFLKEVLPESGRCLDEGAIQQYVQSLEQFEKVWCLYDGANLIGTVGIRRMDETNCELKALYLYSKYHGQGLGYRLLSTALEEARQVGYEAMYLDTISTSERAIRLYKAVGFAEIEQYKETIRSDVFMKKRL